LNPTTNELRGAKADSGIAEGRSLALRRERLTIGHQPVLERPVFDDHRERQHHRPLDLSPNQLRQVAGAFVPIFTVKQNDD